MNNNREISTTDAPNRSLTNLTLEDFRAFHYFFNTTPDRETRTYFEDKIVSVANIIELNDLINEKLKNHDPITSQATITVNLNDNRTLSYEFWAKFLEEKWHTSAVTKNIIITWDFTLSLKGYEVPQRHTIKLRIGSKMNVKEVIELVISHEGEQQITEAFAHSICSVDFINPVISNEIFLIVETWHKSLPKNLFTSKWHEKLRKYSSKIRKAVFFLVLMSGATLLYGLFRVYIEKVWNEPPNQLFFSRIYQWLLLSFLFFILIFDFGRWWSGKITEFIDKIKPVTLFKFTKGDENYNEENKKKNTSLVKDIGLKVVVTIIFYVLSVLTINIWNSLFDLFKK